jgi:molybdopterin-containing oxidoreductase family iron-sulfur binding subunit
MTGASLNNGWLQETHDPLTKLIWDNARWISVDAGRLGSQTNDVVKIEANGKWMEAAAYVCRAAGGRSACRWVTVASAASVGDPARIQRIYPAGQHHAYVASGVKVSKTGEEAIRWH